MPAVKEAMCRNPKCFGRARVYVHETEPPPPTGFYVFKCGSCGKQVLFPATGLERTDQIPTEAIIAEPFE